ncbi:MAG TPA: GntR family transcriptional regulator [Burkholderiaceae bacterium]|nr:GntR family transcriptional regulator [Burkholderiaceae bacterium]
MRVSKKAPQEVRESRPLAVIAFERLRNDIIQCKLPPGSKITESGLCQLYGFSKAPVRTALFKLSQEGLVRTVPRHGYVIAPITIKGVRDMFELRLVLEPAVARMAVGRIDVDELRDFNVAPGSSKAEQAEMKFLAANRQFHLAIARASGNLRMLVLMTQLLDDMAKLLHLGLFSSDWRAGSMLEVHHSQAQQHEDLINAFARSDPNAVAEAARLHVEESRDLVMKALLSQQSVTVGRVALA